MAMRLKNHVSRKILNFLSHSGPSENDIINLASKIELCKSTDSKISLLVPVDTVAKCARGISISDCLRFNDNVSEDKIIQSSVYVEQQKRQFILVHLDQQNFIKHVLESKITETRPPSCGKRVIVEYSSPNIAKPMHVGNLRSTIIGNFVCNIHEWFGYDVVRLNYLGDWGTQFGLVKVGMKILNPSQEELSKNPLSTLYQAYIAANAAAENNPSVAEDARKIFMNLEKGKHEDVSDWRLYKEYTIAELMRTYSRLGITFNKYSWESDYKVASIGHILQLMESSGLIEKDLEGRLVVNVGNKKAPILKSDGTTLYLTRDVAAAIDRQNKFKFDKMYYLADTSQHNHFKNLFSILQRLNFSWADNLEHIRFGRVRGMSTRRGTAFFLNDILDEAYHLMIQQQKASPNTKVNLTEDERTADILGVSAIVVADLIHKRMRDYNFEWKTVQSMTGNTGVRLQYTHCRLKSLHKKCGLSSAPACDPFMLSEAAAMNLVFEISRFDEVLQKSFKDLEASKLAEYLFVLCDAINQAILILRVSNAGKVGEQRLLLFEAAREVLHQGMTLMGLSPLDQM